MKPPVAETPELPTPSQAPGIAQNPPTLPVVAEGPPPTTLKPVIAYPPINTGAPMKPPVAETPKPPTPTQAPSIIENPPTIAVVAETQTSTTSKPGTKYPPAITGIPVTPPYAETNKPPRPSQGPAFINNPPTVPIISEIPIPSTGKPETGYPSTIPTYPVVGQGPSYPLPPSQLPPLIEYPSVTERPIPGTARPIVTPRPQKPGFELPYGPIPITNRPLPSPNLPLAVIPPKTGCISDDGCQDNESCDVINERCINPCAVYNPCIPNAVCSVIYHRPVCSCAPGFTGVPSIQCQPGK